jgi:hypothetical protein
MEELFLVRRNDQDSGTRRGEFTQERVDVEFRTDVDATRRFVE